MNNDARRSWLFESCLWGTLYVLAGGLGLLLGGAASTPTPFQPAAGVALAGALSRGPRCLPGLALGALSLQALSSQAQGSAAAAALALLAVAAVLAQAALGAAAVRRFVAQPLVLADRHAIGRFFMVAAAAALVGTVVAVAAALNEGADGRRVAWHATAWWFGQAAGSAIVAPMVLAWTGRPRVDWAPRRSMLALPLAVLAAATALGLGHVSRLDAEREHARFDLEASSAAALLSAQLLEPAHALEAVRSLFLVAPSVDRQAFRRATRAWLDLPGHLLAIGWSERLAFADIAAFEARARAEGFDGLRVQSATGDGGVRPVRPDEPMLVIRHIEPYERNRFAPGINSYANPAAAPVIEAALRSGHTVATPAFPLRLPDGSGAESQPQGVVIYRALYRGEPATDAARSEAAYGVVFATLRMSEIFASVAREVPIGYTLCLVDLDAAGGPRRIAGTPGCDRSALLLHYRRSLDFADRRWELRVGVPAGGGSRPMSFTWTFAVFAFAGLAALGAMLLALTGRTRRVELAVAEAERARAAAVAANQARSDFLSRMSHELRTPLNAVLGFTQLMDADTQRPLDPQRRRWNGLIQQAGWHLLEMINDILDLSRIEGNHLDLRVESVGLAPLIEQAIAMVEQSAQQRGITIRANGLPQDVQVRADATRVTQILTNLLSNAIKYNVENGRVEVSCTRVGERASVEVRDTGLGMSPEQLAQLFQPFNRLGRERSETPGTGIGLVVSRRLADMMGGQLQVSSVAGQGSSFVLSLPLFVGSSTPERAASDAPDAETTGTAQHSVVHYVEDNQVNIELMRSVLAQRPRIRLDVSTTGQQALAAMRAQSPDLVLLDLHLPDLSGLEVLQQMKADAALAPVPVVVVSANAMEAQVEAAFKAGAVNYLTKPIDVRRFLSVLDKLLAVYRAPSRR